MPTRCARHRQEGNATAEPHGWPGHRGHDPDTCWESPDHGTPAGEARATTGGQGDTGKKADRRRLLSLHLKNAPTWAARSGDTRRGGLPLLFKAILPPGQPIGP